MFIIVSILWYVDFFVFLPLPQCIFSAFLASCVVSASISTKLADAPEGCAAIHMDLDRLEKWAEKNLTKLIERKCKVMPQWRNNPMWQCIPGVWQGGKQLCKEPGSPGGEVDREPAVCPCCKDQQPPELRKEGVTRKSREVILPSAQPWGDTSGTVLGSPVQKQTWLHWLMVKGLEDLT